MKIKSSRITPRRCRTILSKTRRVFLFRLPKSTIVFFYKEHRAVFGTFHMMDGTNPMTKKKGNFLKPHLLFGGMLKITTDCILRGLKLSFRSPEAFVCLFVCLFLLVSNSRICESPSRGPFFAHLSAHRTTCTHRNEWWAITLNTMNASHRACWKQFLISNWYSWRFFRMKWRAATGIVSCLTPGFVFTNIFDGTPWRTKREIYWCLKLLFDSMLKLQTVCILRGYVLSFRSPGFWCCDRTFCQPMQALKRVMSNYFKHYEHPYWGVLKAISNFQLILLTFPCTLDDQTNLPHLFTFI